MSSWHNLAFISYLYNSSFLRLFPFLHSWDPSNTSSVSPPGSRVHPQAVMFPVSPDRSPSSRCPGWGWAWCARECMKGWLVQSPHPAALKFLLTCAMIPWLWSASGWLFHWKQFCDLHQLILKKISKRKTSLFHLVPACWASYLYSFRWKKKSSMSSSQPSFVHWLLQTLETQSI